MGEDKLRGIFDSARQNDELLSDGEVLQVLQNPSKFIHKQMGLRKMRILITTIIVLSGIGLGFLSIEGEQSSVKSVQTAVKTVNTPIKATQGDKKSTKSEIKEPLRTKKAVQLALAEERESEEESPTGAKSFEWTTQSEQLVNNKVNQVKLSIQELAKLGIIKQGDALVFNVREESKPTERPYSLKLLQDGTNKMEGQIKDVDSYLPTFVTDKNGLKRVSLLAKNKSLHILQLVEKDKTEHIQTQLYDNADGEQKVITINRTVSRKPEDQMIDEDTDKQIVRININNRDSNNVRINFDKLQQGLDSLNEYVSKSKSEISFSSDTNKLDINMNLSIQDIKNQMEKSFDIESFTNELSRELQIKFKTKDLGKIDTNELKDFIENEFESEMNEDVITDIKIRLKFQEFEKNNDNYMELGMQPNQSSVTWTMPKNVLIQQNVNSEEFLIIDSISPNNYDSEIINYLVEKENKKNNQTNSLITPPTNLINVEDLVNINELVPVAVSLNDTEEIDYIFWFEPTQDFISKLPQKWQQVLNPEINAINDENFAQCGGNPKSEPAIMDVWRACNGVIKNLEVYPSPAIKDVTIKFNLESKRNVKLYINDLNGRLVQVIENFTTSGYQEKSINLESLRAGMYYVVVESELGELAMQRIIIEK